MGKSWSGASGTSGGKGGKTFGGSKNPKGAPSLPKSATGHTAGKMPGNMGAHSTSKTPFQNTGKQPEGAKLLEVSLMGVKGSNAHNPPASQKTPAYHAKLEASLPYAMPGSWSGSSGTTGGKKS